MERFKNEEYHVHQLRIRRYSSRHDIDGSNVVNKNTSTCNSKEGLSENRERKSEKSEDRKTEVGELMVCM